MIEKNFHKDTFFIQIINKSPISKLQLKGNRLIFSNKKTMSKKFTHCLSVVFIFEKGLNFKLKPTEHIEFFGVFR